MKTCEHLGCNEPWVVAHNKSGRAFCDDHEPAQWPEDKKTYGPFRRTLWRGFVVLTALGVQGIGWVTDRPPWTEIRDFWQDVWDDVKEGP